MKPIAMVLAEAGLELVPHEIQNHPAVVRNAKKRGKKPSDTILDISIHYRAMKNLVDWYKRGRPDIVHISLLSALSSPLNMRGLLRVYVHTVNDIIIHLDPSIRIPRNYNRFIGLMEQLLTLGRVPPDSNKPLMWTESKTLRDFVAERLFNKVIVMHEDGRITTLRALGESIAMDMKNDRAICIVIGAFQRGDFRKEVFKLASELVSIYPKPLDTWVVVSRVIAGIEQALGML